MPSVTSPTAAYVRIVHVGTILGAQSWSTGFAMSPPPGAVSQGDLDALLAAIETLSTTWWGNSGTTGVGSIASNVTLFRGLRAYLYAAGGGPAALQAVRDRVTPLAGNGAAASPTQTSLVTTMLTGLPGRSFRGRVYNPATAIPLGADHGAAQGLLDRVSGAWQAYINGINLIAAPEFGRVVVHGARGNYPVSAVRTDSEPDVQRRRADKIIAARQSLLVIS